MCVRKRHHRDRAFAAMTHPHRLLLVRAHERWGDELCAAATILRRRRHRGSRPHAQRRSCVRRRMYPAGFEGGRAIVDIEPGTSGWGGGRRVVGGTKKRGWDGRVRDSVLIYLLVRRHITYAAGAALFQEDFIPNMLENGLRSPPWFTMELKLNQSVTTSTFGKIFGYVPPPQLSKSRANAHPYLIQIQRKRIA